MKTHRPQPWMNQKERGSLLLTKAMVWIMLRIGPSVTRVLLYPISIYFFLFSWKARKASRSYLSKILKKRPSARHIFLHFLTFAQSLFDRVFFLTNRFEDYKLEVSGMDTVEEKIKEGKGCILLGSHLGSFDLVRVYGKLYRNLSVKILMDEKTNSRILELIKGLDPDLERNLISAGTPESIIRIKELLSNGTFVGILGDRLFDSNKFEVCNFLGEDARFPTGPFLLASILESPVILFFGIRLENMHYKIFFEIFSEKITIDKISSENDLSYWVNEYTRRLEFYCRKYPYNWFNFFELWSV